MKMSCLKKVCVIALCTVIFAVMLSGCADEQKGTEYFKYVKLGQYKGLEVEKNVTPSETEILDEYLEMLSPHDFDGITDIAVRDGDAVNITFIGYLDGEKLEDAMGTGVCLIIGSDVFIDGFEDACIGVMPGEEFNINVTFPDNYVANDKLSGKNVTYVSKINYIYPPISDVTAEIASEGDYTDGEEFYEYLKSILSEELESEWATEKQNQVLNLVYENSEIMSYPDGMLEGYISEIETAAESYGKNKWDYIGVDEENYDTVVQEMAEHGCGLELIIHAIAEAENITVTESEYEIACGEYSYYGYESKEEFIEFYGKDYIIETLLSKKVTTFLVDSAVEIEVSE